MRQSRSILLVVIGAISFTAIGILVYLLNPPSDQHVGKFIRPTDQKEVLCPEPRSESITKDVHVKLDATVEKILGIAKGSKGSGGVQFDWENIVRELPSDVYAFERMEYIICAAYGNGILTEDEYKVILNRILPAKNRISERSQTPTQEGRTGIWVARIRGDDDQYSSQRELVQELVFYLGKESALKNLVEVRELTQEVTGTDESERETLARQLGQRVNAAMVIWGEIASLLKKDEFFPRIAIAGAVKGIDSTIRLKPVTEISRIREYQTPQPYILRTSPERVHEPIRLARYVVAIRYYNKQDWSQAAAHFEALIQGGNSYNIHDRDLHTFAGYSNWYLHFSRDPKDFLSKAKAHFLSAKQSYENTEKDSGYPYVLNMLGIIYPLIDLAGTKPSLEEAEKLLTEASSLWTKAGDEEGYWSAQGNLGLNYRIMALRGIDIQRNIERAIRILEEQLNFLKEHGNTAGYSSKVNLGYLYMERSDKGPPSTTDLQQAVKHFLSATEHNNNRSPWSTYMAGENGLAEAYARLVRFGVDVKGNLSKCIAAREEVISIYQEHKFLEKYAEMRMHIARTYTDAAEKGIDFSENMTKAIFALKMAAARYKDLNQWAKYANAQGHLAASYWDLAQQNIDRSANLLQLKLTLEDGIDLFRKYGLTDQEKEFKEMLEPIKKALGDREKQARFHQVSCFKDSSHTMEYWPDYSSGTSSLFV